MSIRALLTLIFALLIESKTLGQGLALRIGNNAGLNESAFAAALDNPLLHLQEFTIETLFKPLGAGFGVTGDAFGATVLGKPIQGGSGNYILSYLIQWRPSDSKVLALVGHSEPEGVVLTSDTQVPLGQVGHVALTFDGSFVKLYVNGSLEDSVAWPYGTVYYGSDQVLLGASNFGAGFARRFDGVVDDVMIWDHVRSEMQILMDMTCAMNPFTEGLVAYWSFDDSAGTDNTGHGLDMTFLGSCSIDYGLGAYVTDFHEYSGTVNLGDFIGDPTGIPVYVEVLHAGFPAELHSLTLDSNSRFSFESPLCGSFQVAIKPSHWLRKSTAYMVFGDDNPNINFDCINGDIDGDNYVGLLDYDIFSLYFDRSSSDEDWSTPGTNGFAPRSADLDGDDAVTLLDYDVFSKNFDMSGDES